MDEASRLGLLSLNSEEDKEDQELLRQPEPVTDQFDQLEEDEEFWLDSFLLSLIFSHVRDGPTLAQLRLVNVRWCKVIDEDKRLWKDLLWRDFGWRKATGKGRAKKAKKVEAKGYSKLYGQLFRARRVAAAKKAKRERLHAERLARTVALLPEIAPLLCSKLGKACGADHPWRVCPHPARWLQVADNGREKRWCRCSACGVEVLVRDAKYWREHYPLLLNVVTNEDTRPRYVAGVAAKLHLGTQTSIGADALTAAHDTYKLYLDCGSPD